MILAVITAFAKADAQIVINELDVDNPSTDTMEFIELKTDNPFESLNGYVMVLFNGSTSSTTGGGRTYLAIDLNGLTSDGNGLVVLGNQLVSPVPDRILFNNTFQNGADAVGIYLGTPADFPERTSFATTTNLIDALVYETSDATNTNLLNLLGQTTQYDENENGNRETESLQRLSTGVFVAAPPTPFSLNDTGSQSFVGVDFNESISELMEGETFTIEFLLDTPQNTPFTLNYSFNNSGFDSSDFTGPTSVTFAAGQQSMIVSFTILDDTLDEGDEFLKINIDDNLPTGFKRLRDNVEITVIDNDFTVAGYGTPLNPTYGNVVSTAPANYYQSLDGLAGAQLEAAITALISEEFVTRIHTYADVITILNEADQSPLNSNKVWLMYNEIDRSKIDFQGSSSSAGKWNREHIWSRSRGRFTDIEYDDVADGMSVWTETNADSLRHGQSDAHHLRPVDSNTNSSRGNQDYPEYNGPQGSQGSWHGDVARAMFYMDYRYNNLALVDSDPANSTVGQMGVLSTLLNWHRMDPPDDYEMNRNNVIYDWQINRNPFIDNPDLAEFVYGNMVGQPFVLSAGSHELDQVRFFPNPSRGLITLTNIIEPTLIEIFDLTLRAVKVYSIQSNHVLRHNLKPGSYLVKITERDSGRFKMLKLAVQ